MFRHRRFKHFRGYFLDRADAAHILRPARVQYYLDIEGALARAQARLGIIPAEAADEILAIAMSRNSTSPG